MEKEVNMTFLQETKERIQHQKQGAGSGNYHMVRNLRTGPSFVIPPSVMDYIPGPAFLLISTLNPSTFKKTLMKSKSDSFQIHTEIPQHQAELFNTEWASYLKVVPLYQQRKQHRWESPSISLSVKGRRKLKATKVGICLKISVGVEQTE